MSVIRIYESKDVMRYITERIDDSGLLDEGVRTRFSYEITHDMRGDSATIPRGRAALVTLYNRAPDEHKGYLVRVPVVGTRWERSGWRLPIRSRYYYSREMDTALSMANVSDFSDEDIALAATVAAVYSVATGKGQSGVTARTRFSSMMMAYRGSSVGREEARGSYIEGIDPATRTPEQVALAVMISDNNTVEASPTNSDPQTFEWPLYNPYTTKNWRSWPVQEV